MSFLFAKMNLFAEYALAIALSLSQVGVSDMMANIYLTVNVQACFRWSLYGDNNRW